MNGILRLLGLAAVLLAVLRNEVLAQNTTVSISGGVKLGAPVQLSAEQNALQSLSASSSANGKLAYAFRSLQPKFQNYLGVATVREGVTQTVTDTNAAVIRPVEGFSQELNVIYDPVFSPNGRYVLFKKGWPYERYSHFRLYIWDTTNNQIKELISREYKKPLNLTYPLVSWSPDNNYLAFVAGGDAEGNTEQGASLLLHIYNWRTGQERLIVKNKTVRFSFEWTAPNTLLYGVLPEGEEGKAGARPNIYEIAATDDKPKLVVKDGYRPVPSPDGKWIAFFGSENIEEPVPLRPDWEYSPRGAALIIARRDGSERKALNRESVFYSTLQWMPDSKHLLTISYAPKDTVSSNADKPEGKSVVVRIQVREWDITSGTVRRLALLQAKDVQPIPRPATNPQFQTLGVSKDGSHLFVKIIEITGVNEMSLIGVTSLQSVDLQSGAVATLSKTQNDLGIDWHFATSSKSTGST